MLEFVKSRLGQDPLLVEAYFDATPDQVFTAWTDPEAVKIWFGHKPNSLQLVEIDLKPGGKWRFLMANDSQRTAGFEGEYLEIEQDRKLVFSWMHVVTRTSIDENGDANVTLGAVRDATPASRVEVIFTAKGKGTQVSLVHSDISNDDARKGIGGGWEASFSSLIQLIGQTR